MDNIKNNIFVTQINEREDDNAVKKHAVVDQNPVKLLEMGKNTLQKTLVLRKGNEIDQVDTDLQIKRAQFNDHMEKLSKRRLVLQQKQLNLKKQIEKDESFIRENDLKRRRAIAKYQNEVRMLELKTKEEQAMQQDILQMRKRLDQLKEKVKVYKQYEEFLFKVIEVLPSDYIKGSDNVLSGLMMRHNTLSETNNQMLNQMNGSQAQIQKQHDHMNQLKQKYNSTLLAFNAQISQLYEQYEKEQQHYNKVEENFLYKHGDIRSEII